ncbi:MAG: VWA domain-containing protein [Gordonia sp. (in: high G+C Gram-positive bacteria)]
MKGKAGGGGVEFSDDDAEQTEVDAAREAEEAEVVRRALDIASRLARPRPTVREADRSATGRLMSVKFDPDADELDLDRTMESLVEKPVLEEDDIIVRARRRRPRSIALVVDVSGSMRGERVQMAAATVGAVAAHLDQTDRLALIAFWSDAALIAPLGPPPSVPDAIRSLLALPARGLTNVSFPLEVAARQLASAPARYSRVLLLSDCVHNAGKDPREVAARLPRLDVLLDAVGEHDTDLARELAQEGRGSIATISSHREVAPALDRLLDG